MSISEIIDPEPSKKFTRQHVRVIIASSLGSIFEWYDFSLYASLAANIAKHFFSSLPESSAFVMALFTFASGLAIRPFGALLFGHFGDKTGRKYSFLATITIMGLSTFLVGLLPTYETIGIAAPIILIILRCLQGLAAGGEYGGAAIYVAEYAPHGRRGLYTGFLQSTSVGGFLLCLIVVIVCQLSLGTEKFEAWGWRIPFLISFILLVISVYIRSKLHESPVFKQIKSLGQNSKRPLKDSFTNWSNLRVILTVLFGAVSGQASVSYSTHLFAFYFITQTLKIDSLTGNILLAAVFTLCVFVTIFCGWISDKIGRKPLIMTGFILFIIIVFPIYRGFTHFGNPDLERAMEKYPVIVYADPHECSFQFIPSELKQHIKFTSSCDLLRNLLNKYSVSYTTIDWNDRGVVEVKIGNTTIKSVKMENLTTDQAKQAQENFTNTITTAILQVGYPIKANPSKINIPMLLLIWFCLISIKAMTYGSIAAWMVELFPTKIRYTSLSLPYHIGNGWIGGFLPTIAFSIVLMTGNIYAGLWYPMIITGVTFMVGMLFLNETKDVDLLNDEEITHQTLPISSFFNICRKYYHKIYA